MPAPSVTVSVPLRVPFALGRNVTETAQFALPAKVFGESGQVEVAAKSPEAAMLAMLSGPV